MSKLILLSSPIGHLGDLSSRAIETLKEADLWWVEDTRISGKLQQVLNVQKPMKVINEHTSEKKIMEMLAYLQEKNLTAVLLSDAGSPGISDPGSLCVDLAYQYGVNVDGIPGPSAVVQALMLSGFFAQRFVFLGFLGRKTSTLKKELKPFEDSSLTLVLFESPYRILKVLKEISLILPDRRYAVCREMTKIYQQVYRNRFPYVPNEGEVPTKGEFTIVIEGKRSNKTLSQDDDLE